MITGMEIEEFAMEAINIFLGGGQILAKKLISHYKLTNKSSILDIGSGKGFLLYELSLLLPGCSINGIDISTYAIENSKEEIKANQISGICFRITFRR